ncbi:MAG: metallophosphoesterase [Ginsengibacter sp.]
MKKNYFICILLLFFYVKGFSQNDSIQARIILIGDAGKLNFNKEPVIDAARKLIPLNKKTTVLFLGDNLYEGGLTGESPTNHKDQKAVLDSQANISKGTGAKVIFIPGNHDWYGGARFGLDNVKKQGEYINKPGNKKIQFLPEDGCPGPVAYAINEEVVLVLYDSQWFLQKDGRPGLASDCSSKTEEQFYKELSDILSENKNKLVILAGHHTLKSYGVHGGYFTLKQHIFPFTDLKPALWIPLLVIGSIYPIVRGVFGMPEDMAYPAYSNMITNIEKIVKPYSNVIFVAGHEHTLQLIKDNDHYFIVSGAGSKKTPISNGKNLLYKAESLGFAALNISKNKNVQVDFYTVNSDSAIHSFTKHLLNFSSPGNEDTISTISKPTNNEIYETAIPQSKPVAYFKDSVIVAVNSRYDNISGLQRRFAGKNYRKEWAKPVHLKIFRINQEMGGFTIKKLGGGHQTKSLKLLNKDGSGWTLRTVDKDVEGALPQALKGTVAQYIVQDMISAQAPYGALVIPGIAEAANVIHTNPKYFFVPDDPALGQYRNIFANKVCLLEPENPVEEQTSTMSTEKVIDKVIKDGKSHEDQEAVLRSRLLDMVIGDWDRHFDQWKFGTADTGIGKLYFPIPRDRDQAFFNSNGLLMKVLSFYAFRYLQGFKSNYPSIKWFNWEERDFDRIFMNNLDKEKWEEIINQFQKNVTDSVIEQAVKSLPPEIYTLDGAEIAKKLENRRDFLTDKGIAYYRFLSKEVNVVGSDKNEFFRVSNNDKGLAIKVFKIKKHKDTSELMYHRTFDPKVTKYINLYGLHGSDIFYVDSNVTSKIRLRIVGGKGKDTFNINGNIRNKIYDYYSGKNFIEHSNRTRNKISTAPHVNDYSATGFNYNTYVPLIDLGYNVEDKLLAGFSISSKTYGFRKEPFSTQQKFSALFGLNQKAYQLKYSGEFNQVIGNKDLVIHSAFFNPVLNSFYGLGNLSENDKSLPYTFYHVRYKYVQGEVLLRKRYFNDLLQFYAGPTYFHYWNNIADNENKILSHPSLIGLDSTSIYSGKSYVGGKFEIVVDNINNKLLPTRGVIWRTELTSLFGTNSNSHQITKLTSGLTVYASLTDPAKVVAVLGLGAGHIFTDKYEYFQALTLGANNFLRGFRKNRFSGQTLLYQTTELRIKLFESGSYVLPGAVGLIGFNEVGRVWVKNENSHSWHDDFGGGIYYSPYNLSLISATLAHSKEDNLFNFSISTKFNLTF